VGSNKTLGFRNVATGNVRPPETTVSLLLPGTSAAQQINIDADLQSRSLIGAVTSKETPWTSNLGASTKDSSALKLLSKNLPRFIEFDPFLCGATGNGEISLYSAADEVPVKVWQSNQTGGERVSLTTAQNGAAVTYFEGAYFSQVVSPWRIVLSPIRGVANPPSPGAQYWDHLARQLHYAADTPAKPSVETGTRTISLLESVTIDNLLTDANWKDVNVGHGYCVYKAAAIYSTSSSTVLCDWQYQLSGFGWINIPDVREAAALILPKDASVRINGAGCISGSLFFRAFDGTSQGQSLIAGFESASESDPWASADSFEVQYSLLSPTLTTTTTTGVTTTQPPRPPQAF
jgi:hypothetical protein